MDIPSGSHSCKLCNKNYKSYKSLWNHNKKFHNDSVVGSTSNVLQTYSNCTPCVLQKYSFYNKDKKLLCSFCLKKFSSRQNKWKHEQICKHKENIIEENKNLKIEIEKLNKKSNNKIVTKNSNITNNHNNINNGTINNTFIINKIGEESLNKLTFNDIKNIFRQQKNCLYHAIKYVNFNEKIPENHSFYNNSLEGKYINVFNNDNNEIEKKNKKDFFDNILLSSINITNLLYDKVKDDLSKKKQLKLETMIKEIENIAHLDNNKKLYITNFNELSYNHKKIVKNTWDKKINDLEIKESLDDSSCYDSDSSKDSFYYVTDSD
jgi:hypothetical protein